VWEVWASVDLLGDIIGSERKGEGGLFSVFLSPFFHGTRWAMATSGSERDPRERKGDRVEVVLWDLPAFVSYLT